MIRATGADRTTTRSETVDNLQNRSPTPRLILILDSPGLPGPVLAVECAEQAFSVIDATCCDQESGTEGGPLPGIDRTFHADISTVSTALHERRYVQLQYGSCELGPKGGPSLTRFSAGGGQVLYKPL
jgi:hypothetical protein